MSKLLQGAKVWYKKNKKNSLLLSILILDIEVLLPLTPISCKRKSSHQDDIEKFKTFKKNDNLLNRTLSFK